VKKQAARGRAKAEINTLIVALENYKADYGGYPQDPSRTDGLDARDIQASLGTGVGSQYALSSLYLTSACPVIPTTMGSLTRVKRVGITHRISFKPSRLFGPKVNGKLTAVQYVMDPFGNSYGYSTAGLLLEQEYRASLTTNPGASRPATNSREPKATTPPSICGQPPETPAANAGGWVKNW